MAKAKTTPAKRVRMVSGYCYEAPARNWRKSKDDDWDTEMCTPDGTERLLGFRHVDGSRVAVFSCADKSLVRAQTVAGLGIAGMK